LNSSPDAREIKTRVYDMSELAILGAAEGAGTFCILIILNAVTQVRK